MKHHARTFGLAFLLATVFSGYAVANEKPRLILQITVDQLRGDLPTRYADRFGEGGFRYLLEDGIHYTNAHHAHANTETVVGHTTLATGANPAAMARLATSGSTGQLDVRSTTLKTRITPY